MRASVRTEAIFDRYPLVHIAFSGGKESVVLADMALPWASKIILLWVNTGDVSDDHARFVRSYGERFRLIELNSDVRESWKKHGPPANVIAVESMRHLGSAPRWQSWTTCCWRNRHLPLVNAMRGAAAELRQREVETVLLYGQREQDRAFSRDQIDSLGFDVPVHAPLWEWARDDVMDYIAKRSLTLSPHYAEIEDSIECLTCSAELSPEKLAFLDRHYPEAGQQVRDWAQAQLVDARSALSEIEHSLLGTARTGPFRKSA